MAEETTKRAPKKDWKTILRDSIVPMVKDFAVRDVAAKLRKIYYNLVVKEKIGNTTSDYNTLSGITVDARMNGIIPIDSFVDDIRDTINFNGYKDDDDFEDIEDYIKKGIEYLRDAPDDYVNSLPKWYKQENYIEHWLEKDAIYPSFEAYLGDNRQLRIKTERGYDSLGALVVSVERLRRITIDEPYKEIYIWYFGDMDPSGDDMGRDLSERIKSISAKLNIDGFVATTFIDKRKGKKKISGEDFLAELTADDMKILDLQKELELAKRDDDYKHPITKQKVYGRNTFLDRIRIRQSEIIALVFPERRPHLVPMSEEEERRTFRLPKGQKKIHFRRVAVTEDQITSYNLPDKPRDTDTRDKLERDPRYASHIQKFGRLIAAEVDALDALHPDVLKQLVQDSVDNYYDTGIYKTEILDKYGSKNYKKEINDMVIERLEAEIVKLRRRSDEDDFEDEELEDDDDDEDSDSDQDSE